MTQTATLSAPAPRAVGSGSGYRVEAVTDYPSFLRLERAWNELIEEAGTDFPFTTHEWMRAWIESFGAGKELQILVVRDGGRVVAIAPLMLCPVWTYGLPFRKMQSIHNVYSERFDFIVAGAPEEAYQAIWSHLLEQAPRWDFLELRQLPSGSRTLDEMARLAARDGFPAERWHSCDAPYLRTSGTWDSYLATLDRKHRSNLRNRLAKLERFGEIELELVRGEGLDAALEEGLALEAAAWKGEAGTAIRCLSQVRSFYTRLARGAASRGWLRLYFLKLSGRRIAFEYALEFRNRHFLLKPGYHPDFAVYSPSTALCQMVLRDLFARGIEEYDFLGVNEPWKRRWTWTTRPHDWFYVFRPGLRMRLLRWIKFRVAPRLREARRSL